MLFYVSSEVALYSIQPAEARSRDAGTTNDKVEGLKNVDFTKMCLSKARPLSVALKYYEDKHFAFKRSILVAN